MKTPRKTMGFVVDKVSEDSFYENLLLGVSKILEKSPCVSKLCLQRYSGSRQLDIRNWEHNNGVILPEDLRAFYSSTNGFSYTYNFSYDHNVEEEKRLVRVGKIEINSLEELVRIFGYETKNVSQLEKLEKGHKLTLSRDSKVFELTNVENYGKVVLVYVNSYSIPNIWFYNSPSSFNYLADDFVTYFRMCIAHVGVPCWQCVSTKEGLPEWSREIFQIIAPGVLNEDKNLVEVSKFNMDNTNKIDPNIFVIHPQSSLISAGNSAISEPTTTVLPLAKQNKNKDKRVKSGALKKTFSACKSKRTFIGMASR